MHVVGLIARPRLGWLTVSAIAALGAIAWRVHRAPAAPPPEPQRTTCAIPDVPPPPTTHFAVPPPGDPYPRPELGGLGAMVEAELVDRPAALGDCGSMIVETTMTFHALKSIGFADYRVLVPCAELTRPQFSERAGDAGLLVEGGRYMLTLQEATDVPDTKNDTLWRAIRIDQR
jgi:hypothetical protein